MGFRWFWAQPVLHLLVILGGAFLIPGKPVRIIYLCLCVLGLSPAWLRPFAYVSLEERCLLLAAITFSLAAYAGIPRSRPHPGKLLGTFAVFFLAYLLAIAPLISQKALAHGRGGGSYYRSSCMDKMMDLARSLKRYTDARGLLPRAGNIDELLRILNIPTGGSGERAAYKRPDICPKSIPFQVEPLRYTWIASWSGVHLASLTEFPISCPEHEVQPFWKEKENWEAERDTWMTTEMMELLKCLGVPESTIDKAFDEALSRSK